MHMTKKKKPVQKLIRRARRDYSGPPRSGPDGVHHGEGLRSCMMAGFYHLVKIMTSARHHFVTGASGPDLSLEGSPFGNSFRSLTFLCIRPRIAHLG